MRTGHNGYSRIRCLDPLRQRLCKQINDRNAFTGIGIDRGFDFFRQDDICLVTLKHVKIAQKVDEGLKYSYMIDEGIAKD